MFSYLDRFSRTEMRLREEKIEPSPLEGVYLLKYYKIFQNNFIVLIVSQQSEKLTIGKENI